MLHVLVIKTSSLGDIIQTIPTVLKLKQSTPFIHITWVVEERFKSLLQALRICDEIICCDFKTWKKKPIGSFSTILDFRKRLQNKTYDLVLDFQANIKSSLILSLVKAKEKRGYCLKDVAEWPNVLFTTKKMRANLTNCYTFYDALIQDLISDHANVHLLIDLSLPNVLEGITKKVIMLGFGSFWESKKISPIQITNLLKKLYMENDPYFLIPSEEKDRSLYEQLLEPYQGKVLCFKNVEDYFPYFKKTAFYVGVDSAFLHLAKLFGIKTLGIFGPSSKIFYGDKDDIQGVCPYNKTFLKRCPILRSCEAPCIKNIRF